MKHATLKNLEGLKGKIKMTSDQKNDVEDILMTKISSNLFNEEKNSVDLLTRMADALVPTFNLKPVGVFVMILSLILGSSFGTVSAAKNTLPGDVLYPVKITAENFEYTLAFSKEKKVEVAMKSVEKRIDELKRIAVEKKDSVQIAVVSENLKDNLNKVQNTVQELDPTTVKTIDQNLLAVGDDIKKVSEDSEILEEDAQDIQVEVDKTTIIILSVLVNNSVNDEKSEVEEIVINKDELKDRISENIKNLEDGEGNVNAEALNEIKQNLKLGEFKLAIDGILAITSNDEGVESEVIENAGEVKGDEDTASTTSDLVVDKNNNSSSTPTIISVPVSAIDVLGLKQEEEVSEEFNVGLK